MNKTMSPEQIEANQRNAQKSTGPSTPEGKAVSKMNAVKHGILSSKVVVRGLRIKESSREFAALRQRFWNELSPVGPLEEMLVDEIVTTHWRLRRALTAESGEIALSVDGGYWRRTDRDALSDWVCWLSYGDAVIGMERSLDGIRYLEYVLGEVRAAVVKAGELNDGVLQRALELSGNEPNILTKKLEKLRALGQQNPDGLDAEALRAKHQRLVLDYIDGELGRLGRRRRSREEREQKQEESRQAASVLPAAEKLDKILRYETTLQRQLYRAMHQLERLQRMRKGEHVPAPLTMEVSPRC